MVLTGLFQPNEGVIILAIVQCVAIQSCKVQIFPTGNVVTNGSSVKCNISATDDVGVYKVKDLFVQGEKQWIQLTGHYPVTEKMVKQSPTLYFKCLGTCFIEGNPNRTTAVSAEKLYVTRLQEARLGMDDRNIGPILGGVAASFVLVIPIPLATFLLRKKKHQKGSSGLASVHSTAVAPKPSNLFSKSETRQIIEKQQV